jgi:hypothetical protein
MPVLLVEHVDTCSLIDTIPPNLALVGDDMSRLTNALDRSSLYSLSLNPLATTPHLLPDTIISKSLWNKTSVLRFFALGGRPA